MLRVNTMAQSGRMLKLQHEFSSKKHKIYKSYDVETQETYLTKIVIAKDDYIALYYQHHLQFNVMDYLTKTKGTASTLLNIMPYKSLVMVKEVQADKDPQKMMNRQSISRVLYLSKTFIPGCTLREMVQSQDKRLNGNFCFSLIGNILDFILQFGGVRDLIISSQNIIVGEDNSFHLNYFSTVGLDLLKFDRYIPKIDFEQIFPYLTSKYIEKGNVSRQYDIDIHLNFIVINFITAFFKKDILFQVQFEHEVKKDSIKSQMARLQKKLLPGLITERQYSTLINEYKCVYGRKLQELIKYALQRYSRSEESNINIGEKGQTKEVKRYDWERILYLLYRQQEEEASVNQTKNGEKKFVDQNFCFFGSCLMQLMNHYNNILNYLFTNNLQPQKKRMTLQDLRRELSKQIKIGKRKKRQQLNGKQDPLSYKNMTRFIETAHSLFRERKIYYERGWYIKELYIPIKTGMTFTRIIKYPNWLCMVAKQSEVNLANITAVLNLLQWVLQIEEDIQMLDPLISQTVLRRTLQISKISKNAEVQYEFKGENEYMGHKTYRQYILDVQMVHSEMQMKSNVSKVQKKVFAKSRQLIESDKQESVGEEEQQEQDQSQNHEEKHTSEFLNKFKTQFQVNIAKLKEFIKKYYLTLSEKKVRDSIKINCEAQSKILYQIANLYARQNTRSMVSQQKK